MKSVVFVSSMLAAVSGAWTSTCSVKHDTAMSLDYYKNVKVSQGDCCDLCASDTRCRTAVYSPRGECHLHDAWDSARAFADRGWMLMVVTPAPPTPTQNIVQLAQATPSLSTLVQALVAGKLTATLSGKGPYTVFAPTNDAFAKIPAADLQKLLANPTELDKVLEYHVLAGKFNMRELMSVRSAKTLEGQNVKVSGSGKVINVNDAKVLKADVEATNGVVHVIDTVLMLPPQNIVQLAQATPSLSTLVQALVAGKLTATLSGKGPYTVFAPTNDAFAKIPAADLQKLLANPTELDKVLEYHVLAGKFNMRELMSVRSAKTLEGQNVKVSGSGKVINVNDAKVLKADVEATNGVVHVIDTVLMLPADVMV